MDQLTPNDSLSVVLFSGGACVALPLEQLQGVDLAELKRQVRMLPGCGLERHTNVEALHRRALQASRPAATPLWVQPLRMLPLDWKRMNNKRNGKDAVTRPVAADAEGYRDCREHQPAGRHRCRCAHANARLGRPGCASKAAAFAAQPCLTLLWRLTGRGIFTGPQCCSRGAAGGLPALQGGKQDDH